MSRAVAVCTLALLALCLPSSAQQVHAGADPTRAATTLIVSAEDPAGQHAVSISYGKATWRDRYDQMLPALAGTYTRLGVGWWTTLDTIGPITLGGVRIEAGSYFLGLGVTKDGAFELLVFDSRKAMQARMLPGTTALYRGDFAPAVRAPMTFTKGAHQDVAATLQIELAAATGLAGKLVMRWGTHELSAPLQLHGPDAKPAGVGGK